MAKRGMARPEWTHTRSNNSEPPGPQLQGKAKQGKERAKPNVAGTQGPDLKVHHRQGDRPSP